MFLQQEMAIMRSRPPFWSVAGVQRASCLRQSASRSNGIANYLREISNAVSLCDLSFFLLATAAQSRAQSIGTGALAGCAIWGQVVIPGRSLQVPMLIELVCKDGVPSQKTRVIDGNYSFNSATPGLYQFRVFDHSRRVIHIETRAVQGVDDHIILAVAPGQSPIAGAQTVSLAGLKRQTSRKAHNEFSAAWKASQEGNTRISVEHLLKALEIDPQYPEARINLAAQYDRMGRHLESLQQGRRAFEISPENPDVGYSYAILLLANKNYQECESVARCMIRNQFYLAQMKAALALSLIGQRRDFSEALEYLRQAAAEFPLALLLGANTLLEIGWPEEAVNQVVTYLSSSANPCERARLETWIAKHRQTMSQEAESSHRRNTTTGEPEAVNDSTSSAPYIDPQKN